MDKKTMKLLKVSFFSVIIICILVFVGLIGFMTSKTEDTINEVSNIYMSEINNQVQQKFSSILRIRLSQLQGVYDRTPPDTTIDREDILKELQISAEVRGFSSLDMLSEDGQLESVYGNMISIVDTEYVLEELKQNGDFVARGYNESGEEILLFGITADYRLEKDGKSIALMAGIPMEELNTSLFLKTDDTAGMYFHVIDSKGDFIIRNAGVTFDNYFDHLMSEAEHSDTEKSKQIVQQMKIKMETFEDYCSLVQCFGEEKYIYSSPISKAKRVNWYLITIMPQGELSQCISQLDTMRIKMTIVSILIIVVSMLVMFMAYYKMTRKHMEELAQSKAEAVRASKAKSEFLSSMSHDIRTPMNAIIGMTDIAMKHENDPEQITECLKKIQLSSRHLLGLINDVLDMSKIESGKMELNAHPMSLRDVMNDIVNIVQAQIKQKDQHFDVFIRNIVAEDVICDNIRLNQVLINILSNAVKFTPNEGRIDIHMNQEASPKGEEYIRTHFRVKDTGMGMSEEFQKKVFDTFTREETVQVHQITGTGLGMPIVKSIVELMGGTIELHSELQKGTEFHITLDLKKAEINERDMKLPETWNILVVDNNELLCSSVVSNLEELGVHAEWTMDGHKAVEMVEASHENNRDYDFILIDWKMPGMDGIQTMHEIRKRWKQEVPMFLISAYDWSDVEEQIDVSVIDGFIPKPLFKSTLYDKLAQYMDGFDGFKEKEDENKIDFAGKRILLAEDIDINWEVARGMLEPLGLEFERAVNGKDCVEIFEKSEIGHFDAILMDVRMPVMNGYDATRAIRKLERPDKDLPIIAMTADAFSDDVQVCLDCGMNGHLAKPIDIRECTRVLQRFLE